MEHSRILLVNFTKTEAEKLKIPATVEVDRGYLTDLLPNTEYEDTDKDIAHMFKAYFPFAIHEYKANFIKLTTIPDLEKEFADKLEPYHKKYMNDLFYYTTSGNGFLVVMLGDYKPDVLIHLGIHGITLDKVKTRDKTVDTVNNEFNKVFEELRSEVIMPTHRYISVDYEEKDFYKKYSSSFLIKNIYKNQAGDVLGCYHSNSMYSGNCSPGFFLLPMFRNSNVLVTKLLKELATLNPKLLADLYEPDWQQSDKYMPLKVGEHELKISKIIEKANSLIDDVRTKQKADREKYQYLLNLLTEKHEVLKVSVSRVLEEVFGLSVTDSDKNRISTLMHEDIVIELNGEEFLAEIKGDNASYPSVGHISQLWKHLKNRKEIEKGALILNYDINTEPEKRKLAYTGEEESQLDGIIFIDT